MLRLSVTIAALLSTPLSAQESPYSVGAGLSTFGPTLEGTYTMPQGIDLRGVMFIPLRENLTGDELVDGFEIDGKAETGAFAIMADYYPTGHGWRISGGLFFASDDIVSGTVTNSATNATFTGSLGMEKEVAPIITGGYRHVFDNNAYLSGEVGAIFSGFEAASNSTDPAVISDLADINAELDDLPAYPYVAVTVGFDF